VARRKAAALPAPWRPARHEPRGEWVGPLQRIAVDAGHGYQVVAQEQRGLDGGHRWHVSPVYQGGDPLEGGIFEGWQRDAEIAHRIEVINRPLYPDGRVPFRDFTCPHCHITERDGGTDRPAGKLCVFCRKAEGWQGRF
jgi:hypothetical protein